MNEKNKIYDDKMTKTINNLDGELATIRAAILFSFFSLFTLSF